MHIFVFQESKPDANQWLSAVSPGKSKTADETEEELEDDVLLVYECERDQVNLKSHMSGIWRAIALRQLSVARRDLKNGIPIVAL